ncbi:hypothetical protein G3576_30175 [Roseomonas stagni]|uniref:Uncharacterized protein n=1 Tax=Falsiroseomonas algicola TaxID=2716930 RepID=A0A6M1LUX1_9PROT|nr:hypothetical protein [Falsiroseomonas algicola]NGM24295.1 hypothetical protein [Falsiroseomonas algicola]
MMEHDADLGIRVTPASEGIYSLDEAILLLAGELLLPEMTLEFSPRFRTTNSCWFTSRRLRDRSRRYLKAG